MNKELLLEVKQQILNEPRSLAMGDWKQTKSEIRLRVSEGYHEGRNGPKTSFHDFPRCGTACCIGGWARELAPDTIKHWNFADILKLTHYQAATLFYVNAWAEPYKSKYLAAETPEERAPIAASYIDYFIEKYAA